VLAPVEVLRGVLVFRGIAAADVSAFEAHPQMNPRVPGFYAIFANALVGLGKFDLIEVRAFPRHCSLL
jgi:hypothetical protein